jgi:lysylphosphatidylglycerol synthase-like protein
MTVDRRSRSVQAIGVAAAAGGALLLVGSVKAAGLHDVLDGVARLGFGFVLVFALGGVRCVVRTIAWRLCLDDVSSLSFRHALGAYLAGGAIGNVTPFGFFISEPSKVVLVRDRIALTASIPALAVENLFYTVSVALVLLGGTSAVLLVLPVPRAVAAGSLAFVLALAAAVGALVWVFWTRRRIGTALARRLGLRTDRIGAIEDRMFGFVARHPDRVWRIVLCEALFHASAVFEIWFALRLITGADPSLLTAFALEYVNRTITIAFQFVPMWLGVDEAGTGFVASLIGIGPAAGVTLALARKARILAWTAIGLALWWPTTRACASAAPRARAARSRTPRAPAPAATAFPAPRLSKRSTAE